MITLPDLPYAYDALEPVLSQAAMRLHHDKHHARYVAVVNEAIAVNGLQTPTLEAVIGEAERAGRQRLADNAGQAWNHGFYWDSMTPRAGAPSVALAERFETSFGGLAGAREAFIGAGAAHFGSGWVWLARGDHGLEVVCTHDGDGLAISNSWPLLVCDLWEHAYYLDHQNDRAGFLGAWFDQLANWPFVEAQLVAAEAGGRRWCYPSASGEAGSAPGADDVATQLQDLEARLERAARRSEAARPEKDQHWTPDIFG
jgi:Fe-Mn family superoxide dismutase